ncbi:thioredoxin family protein [Viridibacillus sp. FSL R5-0477]|uniref:Thioredoxin domain-containing protein n=2 Tax=Viridibacillus TaxID=496496 RepID=W4ES71_9BACL|nr:MULTISPECIES: thioredoxin family protein [Viridibacillus]ETT82646.1 Thioredoxin domain-containing protein [Viridibacillus arenosi FSL R5-213]KOO52493.1 thioredoxin [Viridibacillus arvi]OMC82375.1 thiol reductase thioredoxin [Viridibacillus sp. FSL H7-0596]OMC85607.1 thiol reductase thioredoxin [Viridibacillus sp. FSL H8-0123]OMC92278.1 thiol reductase thioredoxin [Viridibacillus arenosi]
MQSLQTIEQFSDLKSQGKTVFLFTAGWCPDCHFIDPFMPEIEEKFEDIQFVSVNRDDFIDLCGDLNIFGIPSFVAFENGEESGRFVSKDRKTQIEIEEFLESL